MNQLKPLFLNRIRNYVSQGYSYELAYKYALEEQALEEAEDRIEQRRLLNAKNSMSKLRFYRK